MQRIIITVIAILLCVSAHAEIEPGRNHKQRKRQKEVKSLTKAEIRRLLRPATIDDMTNIPAELRRYLKAQQKLIRILVEQDTTE